MPDEWSKEFDDIIDFIEMTGKFNDKNGEDQIDQEAQKLFD